jgi:hypothetical protein
MKIKREREKKINIRSRFRENKVNGSIISYKKGEGIHL